MSTPVAGASPPSAEYLAEDRRSRPRIGMLVTTALAFVILLLRLYSRFKIVKKPGLDDAFIIVGFILSTADCALDVKLLELGAGRHTMALTPQMGVALFKHLIAAELVYMIALWALRLSGLAFYARLGSHLHRFNLYYWMAVTFITVTFIIQISLIAFQCVPLRKMWDPTVEGTCLGTYAVFIPTAALTIVCDTLVLFLPVSIVWNLQVTIARKLGLGVVLCFGIMAVITSIFRMISMLPAVDPENLNDAAWYFAPVLVWSIAEMNSAIIALSIPALKPLFKLLVEDVRVFKKSFGSSRKSSSGRTSVRYAASYPLQTIGGSNRPNNSKSRPKNKSANETGVDVSMANSSQEVLFEREEEGIHRSEE